MISCIQINHKFKKGKFELALDENHFNEKGITAFLGANGSGKSTLFELISGRKKPLRGSIRYDGKNTFYDYERIKAEVQLISHEIQLYGDLTGDDHLNLIKGLSSSWDFNLERELIDSLKIPTSLKVSELSRGERAKLRLLLTLCTGPKLVLIDEVTNDLDTDTRRAMYQKLDEYSYEKEAQVFVATNILEDMERYASNVVLMKAGRIVLNEGLDSLKERSNASLENICRNVLGEGSLL